MKNVNHFLYFPKKTHEYFQRILYATHELQSKANKCARYY